MRLPVTLIAALAPVGDFAGRLLQLRIPGAVMLLAVSLAGLAACAPEGGGAPGVEPGASVDAEVTRVVDGDTVEVAIDGVEDRVRYIGLDTPESVAPGEPVDCFGPEAAAYNARIVEGKQVELLIGAEPRDRYGRLLAYVLLGDLLVNAELLRQGFATTLSISPNDQLESRFRRLEERAGRAGVGLWGAC